MVGIRHDTVVDVQAIPEAVAVEVGPFQLEVQEDELDHGANRCHDEGGA